MSERANHPAGPDRSVMVAVMVLADGTRHAFVGPHVPEDAVVARIEQADLAASDRGDLPAEVVRVVEAVQDALRRYVALAAGPDEGEACEASHV